MSPVITALLETFGVVLVAAAGVGVGRWCSKRGRAIWWAGYAVPLILALALGVPRWVPQIEWVPPFSWIMADRTEFVAMALACTVLLTVPLPRLKHRRERVLVAIFMAGFVGRYCALPFFLPAWHHGELASLETKVDDEGICRQGPGYTCGPAAAVTALRRLGVEADEGPLAIAAHTNWAGGTPTDSLCTAIEARYGQACHPAYFNSVADLRGREPAIAVIKFGFMVDHYVTVLAVGDDEVVIGDPLHGRESMTHEDFLDQWRRIAIVFDQPPTTRPAGDTP